jgi:ankyrin repeat protein
MEKGDKVWRTNKKDEKPKVRNCDQQLLNGAYFGNWQVVKKWIEYGGNPNYMEERDGWLPIHYAARWGDMRMLLLLLKTGADIDGKTNTSTFIRTEKLQIETYNGKTDTASVRWVNDCEFILQKLYPKNINLFFIASFT